MDRSVRVREGPWIALGAIQCRSVELSLGARGRRVCKMMKDLRRGDGV